MKLSSKILLIHVYAKWCSRFKMEDRVDILIRTLQLALSKESPKEKLKFLLEFDKNLYILEQNAALSYGDGVHPKHRLINYKHFFIKNLKPNERVLDIGSGNGHLSYKLVTGVPDLKVVGIELDKRNVENALKNYKHQNLTFLHGNALKDLPEEKFDVIILSNVLEHMENRIEFLRNAIDKIKPSRLIIRIPLLERDWKVPLKKELGVDYRLDEGHYIEYTKDTYFEELSQANLKPAIIEYKWGEIWSVVTPL